MFIPDLITFSLFLFPLFSKCQQRTADHVLQQALDPANAGVPKELFQKCVGVCIISVVEAGFIFSGNVGTGILMKHNEKDGSWSPPCAMGLAGIGWGFLIGAALKDIIVFIFDEQSLNSMCTETGLRLGGQLNLSTGLKGGRNYDGGVGLTLNSGKTIGTYSVAYSKGAFLGASVEGAIVGPRTRINDMFYNRTSTTPSLILSDGGVTLPSNDEKPTILSFVYDKLEKLKRGETYVPTKEEQDAKLAAAKAAQAASEEVAKANAETVQQVNAEEEAKKEAAAAATSK